MKEKKKSKFIPFASYLRPTEELLWQSTEDVNILASLMPNWSLSNVLTIGLFLMVVGGCGLMASNRADIVLGVIGTFTGLIGITLIGLRYIYRWIWRKQVFNMAIPDQARYAITSERLFYERGTDLQAETLDNIAGINVLPNNTLSFGAVFPQWSGLKDAEYVKGIIEQARAERRQEHLSVDANVSDEDSKKLILSQAMRNDSRA
jgi:hypothetical protein